MHPGVGNSGELRIMARQTQGGRGKLLGTDGFNGEGGKAQAGSFVEWAGGMAFG